MNRIMVVFVCLQAFFLHDAHAQQFANQSTKIALGSLIPKPLHTVEGEGSFMINSKTRIFLDGDNGDLKEIGRMLSDTIKSYIGSVAAPSTNGGSKNSIHITTENAIDSLGDEGYTIDITKSGIIIRARSNNGLFYAVHTLFRLLPISSGNQKSLSVPAGKIVDRPRFAWRGLMLDVGRYFYSVDFLKKYIDYMAMNKLNVFHWHLTEDHGWRIEIKKYPRLTEVAAARPGTQYDRSPHQVTNTPHWGYYTQDQIREVVAYAKTKYVTVVPEIEMPGHSLASLVAYPELSCTGGPFKMPVQWAIQKDIYCAGNDRTFQFLEDVLTEVVELFPSPIIHIGGDEAPKDRWKECERCQARIKKENLKDEHELQSYFIRRIENFLLTKNRKIIGWDEILEGGLAPNATVMSWRGVEGGIAAAKQRHDAIMTPYNFLYFDYYQGEHYLEPRAIAGLLTLERVYSYEPVPAELSADERKYIKGVQANVWSEYIHSPDYVEYMLFPRVAALSEIAWSEPKHKNWNDFMGRMEGEYQRYEKLGINYSKSANNVWVKADTDSAANKSVITLSTNSFEPEIRYTLDASEPTAGSLKYDKPFEVTMPVTIKAATFKDGKRLSKTSVHSVVNTTFQ